MRSCYLLLNLTVPQNGNFVAGLEFVTFLRGTLFNTLFFFSYFPLSHI